MQKAKKKKKRVCTVLLKARGADTLQNISSQLIFTLPNFSWPCFRQQPIFIGLSGNDHYLFTEH